MISQEVHSTELSWSCLSVWGRVKAFPSRRAIASHAVSSIAWRQKALLLEARLMSIKSHMHWVSSSRRGSLKVLKFAGPELSPGRWLLVRAETSVYTLTCIGTNILGKFSKSIILLRYILECAESSSSSKSGSKF